jgi:K+-sensing histidine kinase KdpD
MIRFSLEFIERLQWLGRNPTFESVSQDSAYAISLREIVDEAIELANMREEEMHPLCINHVAEDILVGADRSITVNVIFNFLVNARRFTPGVRKKNQPINVFSKIVDVEDRRFVEVSIEDGGEGLKENIEPMSLFEKGVSYNPGDRDVKGSGLGLYFAKLMIMNSMHGYVCKPYKNDRNGATFVFRYPVVESAK